MKRINIVVNGRTEGYRKKNQQKCMCMHVRIKRQEPCHVVLLSHACPTKRK